MHTQTTHTDTQSLQQLCTLTHTHALIHFTHRHTCTFHTHTQSLQQLCPPTHTHTLAHFTHTHNLCSSCAPQHTHTLAHFTHTDALAHFRCTSLSSLGWGSSGGRGSCRQRRATALPCCHSRPGYRAAEPPACSPDGRNLPGPARRITAAGWLEWGHGSPQQSSKNTPQQQGAGHLQEHRVCTEPRALGVHVGAKDPWRGTLASGHKPR